VLDFVNLDQKLPKPEYRSLLPLRQMRLLQLQRVMREARFGTLVILEGWDGSGKGRVIRKLTEPLEPRGFELVWVREPRSHARTLPWMWRFWKTVPAYGDLAIYDHSWYWRALVEEEKPTDPVERRETWLERLRDINLFERLLVEDRYLVIKIFLHIDPDEQKRRMEQAKKDPDWAWMSAQMDPERQARYAEDRVLVEEMLERTETAEAPWTLVAATDHRHAKIRTMDTVITSFEQTLERHGLDVPEPIVDTSIDSCDDGRDLNGDPH
jgi:polyphosphate kinase 2 (PPK2 family)